MLTLQSPESQEAYPELEFSCPQCGETWLERMPHGRHAPKCETCDPEQATRRRRRRALTQERRDEVTALREQVAQLQAMLGLTIPEHADPPGREAVAKAVRKVALAEGHQETQARLLDLAAAAHAWAALIAVRPGHIANVEAHHDSSIAHCQEFGTARSGRRLAA